MLGVLGGMGPLATVDFLKKLIQETGGVSDQRHIPTVTWSVPQIPDRSNHIVYGAESPYPELRRGILTLQSMGASVVVMPCNTAHFWHEELTQNTGVKIFHIVDAVINKLDKLLADKKIRRKKVGVLGTTGTIKSDVYLKKLALKGWDLVTPSEIEQHRLMDAIALAKLGNVKAAKIIFLQQVDFLKQNGAEVVILGCTEIPAVLEPSEDLIDSNLALARRCVEWFDASHNGCVVGMDNRSLCASV